MEFKRLYRIYNHYLIYGLSSSFGCSTTTTTTTTTSFSVLSPAVRVRLYYSFSLLNYSLVSVESRVFKV